VKEIDKLTREFAKQAPHIWQYKNAKNHCAYVSIPYGDFLKKSGYVVKLIKGAVRLDGPVLGINAFCKDEIRDMKDMGLNSQKSADRYKYAENKNLIEELCWVPHYWLEINKKIIDITKKQFKGLVDLNNIEYFKVFESEDVSYNSFHIWENEQNKKKIYDIIKETIPLYS